MSLELNYEAEVVVDTSNITEEEWLKYRFQGIGGSDAAAVLGISKYKTARDLYFEKIGRKPDIEENNNWVTLEVGKRLEDLVAQIFAKKTGFRIWQEKKMLRHPLFPFMLADTDYLFETNDGTIGILECKTSNVYSKDKWDSGSVPYNYEIQCRHYMAVKNVDLAYIACLYGNTENDFVYQRIDRDLDFEEDMIIQQKEFWNEYVLKQQEPPLQGEGDLVLKSLQRYKNKQNNINELMFDSSYIEVCEKILEMKTEKSTIEKTAKEIEGKIKTLYAQFIAILGNGTKGRCIGNDCEYVITYKPSYRTMINKDALEKMQLNDKEIFEKYATVSESRPFQIKKIIK